MCLVQTHCFILIVLVEIDSTLVDSLRQASDIKIICNKKHCVIHMITICISKARNYSEWKHEACILFLLVPIFGALVTAPVFNKFLLC